MYHFMKKFIAVTTLISATNTYAVPLVEADAFTTGDNKAALDTTSGLVWMDFGVNSSLYNGVSFTTILNELNTTYAGWRLPNEIEVRNLWDNLFGNLSITADHFSPPDYSQEYFRLFDWDNDELETFQEISRIFGYFESEMGINRTGEQGMGDYFRTNLSLGYFLTNAGRMASFTFWTPTEGVHTSGADMSFNIDESYPQYRQGALLVKNSKVPEPSSLVLLVLGLLSISLRYRIKN